MAHRRNEMHAFPGFDGSLPKAMRSLRGRSEYGHKSSSSSKNVGFFQLLASVAGQLLQERDFDEGSLRTLQNTKKKAGHSQADAVLSNKQGQCSVNGHAGEVDEAISRKGRMNSCSQRKKYCNGSSLVCEEIQEQMSKDYSEGGLFGDNVLPSSVGLQNLEDAYSMKQSKALKMEKCLGDNDNTDHCCNCVPSKKNSSTHVGCLERPSGNLEFLDMPMHFEGDQSNTICSPSVKLVKCEDASCMIACDSPITDETPALDSSVSSEETYPSARNNSDSMLYDTINVGCRHNLTCSKARDDDENFLETSVSGQRSPKQDHAKGSVLLHDGSTRKNASVSGSKRKKDDVDDGINQGDGGNAGIEKRQQAPQLVHTAKKRSSSRTHELQVDDDSLCTFRFHAGIDVDSADANIKLPNAKLSSATPASTNNTKLSWKHSSRKAGESHVKVNITSFMVPELSVDLPETATVANLKRAVMEAAMNLLGGGLHVRVLLQGNKIPDETASLVQVGISCKESLDSLGFMLEPNVSSDTMTSNEDPLLLLSSAASQSTTRFPAGNDGNGKISKILEEKATPLKDGGASIHTASYEQVDMVSPSCKVREPFSNSPHGSQVPASGALILHPGLETQKAMDIVAQHMDVGKRRTRRPFTVVEVEALVQAVEMLGTGRWRDVKLRAFDQAKHRTYVDLKDKWKTLVHTAHIAPHQRRGEPVPQQLLDRVLQAHNYWAAQQAKQHTSLGL